MKLLKFADVAELLSCSPSQVHKLVIAGKLKTVNLGIGDKNKFLRIAQEDVESFIREAGE